MIFLLLFARLYFTFGKYYTTTTTTLITIYMYLGQKKPSQFSIKIKAKSRYYNISYYNISQ